MKEGKGYCVALQPPLLNNPEIREAHKNIYGCVLFHQTPKGISVSGFQGCLRQFYFANIYFMLLCKVYPMIDGTCDMNSENGEKSNANNPNISSNVSNHTSNNNNDNTDAIKISTKPTLCITWQYNGVRHAELCVVSFLANVGHYDSNSGKKRLKEIAESNCNSILSAIGENVTYDVNVYEDMMECFVQGTVISSDNEMNSYLVHIIISGEYCFTQLILYRS